MWEESPGDLVLTGGAFVSEDEVGDFIPREAFRDDGPVVKGLPFATVQSFPTRLDNTAQPGRQEIRLRVWVVVGSHGITQPPTADAAGEDTHGINRVKGLLRDATSGQGKSTGRDVDEVVDRLVASLNGGQFLRSVHGFNGWVERGDALSAASGVQVLARSLDIVIPDGTTALDYQSPFGFTLSSLAGTVTASWRNAAPRFDTFKNVLRRGTNPGDAAPSTPTTGTDIPITGGNLGLSATDAGHTPGQVFNYALFHVYSEVNVGDRNSIAWQKGITVA